MADQLPLLPKPDAPEEAATETRLSRPLYDVSHDWALIVDKLVEDGGEMTPENQELWNNIQGEANEKLEACAMVIQTLKSRHEAIKAESKRMSVRASSAKNAVDRLHQYAKTHMETMGIGRVEGLSVSLRIQPTAASCKFIDEPQVPSDFVSVNLLMSGITWDILNAFIKESTEAGIAPELGEIDIKRTVNKKAVVDRWKESHESEQVAGTVVSKGSTMVVF